MYLGKAKVKIFEFSRFLFILEKKSYEFVSRELTDPLTFLQVYFKNFLNEINENQG